MRSRNIKPGYFKNEFLAECDPLARILFAGLWCMADREGRLEYRPKRMKAELLPYDNVKVERLLDQLVKHGFILVYEIESDKYVQILAFLAHQNPHCKEQASTIQAPCKNSSSPADSLNLIPDTLSSDSSGKPSLPKKDKYLEEVYLKPEEHEKLKVLFPSSLDTKIQVLNGYIASQGLQKKYKDHYATILNFARRDGWDGKPETDRDLSQY
jgi:hypothetical protein